MIHIYTDGACSHNGTWDGGWGVVITDGQEILSSFGGGEKNTTNNRMEMTAFLEALKYLNDKGKKGVIYTDSAYVHNAFKNDWIVNWRRNGWLNSKKEPVKNRDLWEEMLMYQIPEIVKVKGHSTDIFNNEADLIAVKWRDKI